MVPSNTEKNKMMINERGLKWIGLVMMLQLTSAFGTTGQTVDYSGMERALEHLVDSAFNDFSGSILVGRAGRTIFSMSRGHSNGLKQLNNKADTRFGLASLGKIFTMLGILKLVEEGRLDLDAKMEAYGLVFDDARTRDITVRQLLLHTSGWGHYWDHPKYTQHADALDRVSAYLEIFEDIPLDFAPGTAYQYSNIGYVVLGAVIERVSGMDYYAFVQSEVFNKLGMVNSAFAYHDEVDDRYAIPHSKQQEAIIPTSARGGADGGAYASITDIQKLVQAVFVEKSYLKKHWNTLLIDGVFELQGAFRGVSTSLIYQEDTDLYIAVLANEDPPVSENLTRSMIEVLRASLAAQTQDFRLNGVVKDGKTGTPIAFANIGIEGKGVGTASTASGTFALEIPRSYAMDTLVFSALGYEKVRRSIQNLVREKQWSIILSAKKQDLNEVVVYGQKLLKATLGSRMVSPMASGAYIGGGRPGASLVTLFQMPRYPAYLDRVAVHVRSNKKEQSFKLRLRIMKADRTIPGDDLLERSRIVTSKIKKGWIEFSFEDEPLTVNEPVFIGVEWIEQANNRVTARSAFPRISYVESKSDGAFTRTTSLGNWNKSTIKPTIKVDVRF